MSSTDLLFTPDERGPLHLVFGDQGGGGVPQYTVSLAGRVSGIRGRVRIHAAYAATAAGRVSGLRGSAAVAYDANVDRPCVAWRRAVEQQAQPLLAVARSALQDAARLSAGVRSAAEQALPVAGATRLHWQSTQALARTVRAFDQFGRPVGAGARGGFQQTVPLVRAVRAVDQFGLPASMGARAGFQQTIALARTVRGLQQQGRPILARHPLRMAQGLALQPGVRVGFQQGRLPSPGGSPRPDPGGDRDWCYVPGLPIELLFRADARAPLHLLLLCDKHGGGPDPEPPLFVIPLLEVYMAVHSLNAVLLPGLQPVPFSDVIIASDDDGFGWSLSASGPESLIDQLAPVDGLPCRVRVTVDGIDWVFAVMGRSRSRSFPKRTARIDGRSVTALLGDLPSQSWLNSSQISAQQIVEQALEFTDVGVDWRLDDWIVPDGAWSFQGTPLQVALRVAESVGAVLRSHRTDAELVFAPRYPSTPWEWPTATPNVQMPAAVITTDDLQFEMRPQYNAVYLHGMTGGMRGLVKRAGTAGDILAPSATDALLTGSEALRQRGTAILGAGGSKMFQTITTPLLTGATYPGPILPGYLVEILDEGGAWRGLVRSISVTARPPGVRQTFLVERAG